MVYQWKEARRIKANPNEAAKVMNDLAERDALTAENLIEVSKPEDAPLHNDFEWDNNIAADEYRKVQARRIISALVVVPDEYIKTSEPVRAYFKIEETGNAYSQLTAIIASPTKKELLLKTALRELDAFEKKYQTLEELTNVFKAIDEVKKLTA